MTRRRTTIVLVLIAAQLVAIAAYLVVRERRDAPKLSSSPPVRVEGRVAGFEVVDRRGARRDIIGRPVLIHFWATWCAPCVDELPLVLDLPEDLPFEVLAVALDDDWTEIDPFIGAGRSPRVVRADRAMAQELFDVSSLPQTVLVTADGELRLRVNGARNWADEPFVEGWIAAIGAAPPRDLAPSGALPRSP